jgi:methylmalonyl-CoA/ethylmalonyl-CoA epimerase
LRYDAHRERFQLFVRTIHKDLLLQVADIYASVNQLKANGYTPLDPKPKTGAHGKPVVFLNPKECNGVLIELEEE